MQGHDDCTAVLTPSNKLSGVASAPPIINTLTHSRDTPSYIKLMLSNGRLVDCHTSDINDMSSNCSDNFQLAQPAPSDCITGPSNKDTEIRLSVWRRGLMV